MTSPDLTPTAEETTIHLVGMDELYCNFYRCDKCSEEHILSHFKFCPTCGRTILPIQK